MSAKLNDEVMLLIEDKVFKVRKETLNEHSDYFRAMFSGNYIENERTEIKIEMIDASSMEIILKYMQIGLIDLFEYSITTLGELAVAANFLQTTELLKQIEYTLDKQMSENNWVEILKIAENCSFNKLKALASSYGLVSFTYMKPEYIPTIDKLYWYLSHPYIYTFSELEVFKFGLRWISLKQLDVDAVLVVLFCLDIRNLTMQDLSEIYSLISTVYANSLGLRIIECLHDLSKKRHELSAATVTKNRRYIIETYSERIYNEVNSMVIESNKRMLKLTPTVPKWEVKNSKPEVVPHFLYTYKQETGFEKWLEVAEKDLWGWSVVTWTPTKLVVVCGEHGRGTGNFMKDVKVYDTLRMEWTHHGVELPSRRHAGLTIIGDSLYIVGGVGGFRIVLDTALSYDLKQRSYRKIAKLPDTIQNPAVCSHEGKLFATGHKNIFQYDDTGERDRWIIALGTDIRSNCMMSHKGYIYCVQHYFSNLYRFKPFVDANLEMLEYFTYPPAAICSLGNKLIVFTRTMCEQSEAVTVEEYLGESPEEKPKVLLAELNHDTKINDVAGACGLILEMPPIDFKIPEHQMTHLNRYIENNST